MARSSRWIGLLGIAMLAACSGSGGGGCELVTQGDRFVQVENRTATGVSAFLAAFAFEALIRPGCEQFGVTTSQSFRIDFQQCNFVADNNCVPFGPVVSRTVSLQPGETIQIVCDDAFFAQPVVLDSVEPFVGRFESRAGADTNGACWLSLARDPDELDGLRGNLCLDGELFACAGSASDGLAVLAIERHRQELGNSVWLLSIVPTSLGLQLDLADFANDRARQFSLVAAH